MFIFILSSSRILVMNHSWSAIKQRLHLQSSRDKLPFSSVRGQDSPQGHKSMSVSHHFVPHALQSPSSVQKFYVVMFIFILSSSRILVSWTIIDQPLNSVFICRVVGISCHSARSEDRIHHKDKSMSVSHHFLPHALQSPSSVQKWFSRDHCFRGRSKPGCRIVGSHTRWELTTWADFQLCLQLWLLMSAGCMSCRSCFLDVSRSNRGLRISGWIGQLSCLKIVFIATLWEKKFCYTG